MNLRMADVAALYGVSEQTVLRWVHRDGLPHARGEERSHVLIDSATIQDWLRIRPWMLPKVWNKKCQTTKSTPASTVAAPRKQGDASPSRPSRR